MEKIFFKAICIFLVILIAAIIGISFGISYLHAKNFGTNQSHKTSTAMTETEASQIYSLPYDNESKHLTNYEYLKPHEAVAYLVSNSSKEKTVNLEINATQNVDIFLVTSDDEVQKFFRHSGIEKYSSCSSESTMHLKEQCNITIAWVIIWNDKSTNTNITYTD